MTPSQKPDTEELTPARKVPVKFGEKLRKVREDKGYTLKMVAKAAGVSESLVSQIERNHVSPAIDTLLALAEVLDINLEFLFEEYRRERPVSIIRYGERPTMHEDDITYEEITHPSKSDKTNAFETYVLKIPAHSHTHRGSYGHIGRESGVIISGSCTLKYEDHEYILNKGDSVSFPASCPHTLENNGDEVMKAIWTVCPPQRFIDE